MLARIAALSLQAISAGAQPVPQWVEMRTLSRRIPRDNLSLRRRRLGKVPCSHAASAKIKGQSAPADRPSPRTPGWSVHNSIQRLRRVGTWQNWVGCGRSGWKADVLGQLSRAGRRVTRRRQVRCCGTRFGVAMHPKCHPRRDGKNCKSDGDHHVAAALVPLRTHQRMPGVASGGLAFIVLRGNSIPFAPQFPIRLVDCLDQAGEAGSLVDLPCTAEVVAKQAKIMLR